MSTPLLDPILFDDPRLNPPRRCWAAIGSKKVNGPHQRTKTRELVQYVNASRETVARRVATKWFNNLGYKLSHVYEITWDEYARKLPQEFVSWKKPFAQ